MNIYRCLAVEKAALEVEEAEALEVEVEVAALDVGKVQLCSSGPSDRYRNPVRSGPVCGLGSVSH